MAGIIELQYDNKEAVLQTNIYQLWYDAIELREREITAISKECMEWLIEAQENIKQLIDAHKHESTTVKLTSAMGRVQQ